MSHIECFTYPRLLGNTNATVGYDFGFWARGLYCVLGNSRTRDIAGIVLRQYAKEHTHTITGIVHEETPSKSKQFKKREENTKLA